MTELVKPALMNFLTNYPLIGITLELLKFPCITQWLNVPLESLASIPYSKPPLFTPAIDLFIVPDKQINEKLFSDQVPYMLKMLTNLIEESLKLNLFSVDFYETQILIKDTSINTLSRYISSAIKGDLILANLISALIKIESGKYINEISEIMLRKIMNCSNVDLKVFLKALEPIANTSKSHETFKKFAQLIAKKFTTCDFDYYSNICYIDFVIELYYKYKESFPISEELIKKMSNWIEFHPYPTNNIKLFRVLNYSLKKNDSYIENLSKEANAERINLLKIIEEHKAIDKSIIGSDITIKKLLNVCIIEDKGKVIDKKWVQGELKEEGRIFVKVKLQSSEELWIEKKSGLLSKEINKVNNKRINEKEALLQLCMKYMN